ncbi:MAG: hypothetical protein MZW92_14270 [Comamonadaceae bacterium]|nr:hypothetical protein [Comamonadaceae bacterium]
MAALLVAGHRRRRGAPGRARAARQVRQPAADQAGRHLRARRACCPGVVIYTVSVPVRLAQHRGLVRRQGGRRARRRPGARARTRSTRWPADLVAKARAGRRAAGRDARPPSPLALERAARADSARSEVALLGASGQVLLSAGGGAGADRRPSGRRRRCCARRAPPACASQIEGLDDESLRRPAPAPRVRALALRASAQHPRWPPARTAS